MNELVTQDEVAALAPVPTTADSLLTLAIQKGASIEQMTQLFDLKLKVDANEARKAFVKAMSGFRSEVKTIGKNGKGHNNARYATLDNVTEAVNPILANHGLSFCWSIDQSAGITVHCDVTHTEGHSQRTTLSAAPDTSGSKNAVQAIGSTVTYLQRYTLNAALGLATGVEDDDAKGARGEPEAPTITVEQAAILKDLVERSGADTKLLLTRCGGAPSVDKIHPSDYEFALNNLSRKLHAIEEQNK